MLPKVATQLIHHTTRAVAAVQGSGHTFRNVLQSSSSGTTTTVGWSGVGTSGSSWGSAGTGAGGAKYQSSSKFYHGYQGAGRSLTQASQASAVDSDLNQTDDTEDPFFRPRSATKPSPEPLTSARRPRSHSLVLGSKGQVEDTKPGNRPGILEAVRIHARASHAFAPQNGAVDEGVADNTPPGSRPRLSRRASTSSVTSLPPSGDIISSSLDPQPNPSSDPPILRPTSPSVGNPANQTIQAKLARLSAENDSAACVYVDQLLRRGRLPRDAAMYEAAIQAVAKTCKDKPDFALLVQLFDKMIQHHLSPSDETYRTLILAHLKRDSEVAASIHRYQRSVSVRETQGEAVPKLLDQDLTSISRLRSEPNLRNAIRVFQAANQARVGIPPDVYTKLLRSCVRHLDEYAALKVFNHFEKEHGSSIPALAYFRMMQLYSDMGDTAAIEETFAGFRKACQLGNVSYKPIPGIPSISPVAPWNLMIDAYLRVGSQAEALTVLETMLDTSDSCVPRPSLSTFQTVVAGFCGGGDVETALKWFQRLLQETSVAEDASTPLPAPPRPDAVLWDVMIGALAQRDMISEINSLYLQWLPTNTKDHPSVIGNAHKLVTLANITHLETLQKGGSIKSSELQEQVDYVMEKVVGDPRDWILTMDRTASDTMRKIVKLHARDGRFDEAAKFLETYVLAHHAVVGVPQAGGELSTAQSRMLYTLRGRVLDVVEWAFSRNVSHPVPFTAARVFASTVVELDMSLSAEAAGAYLSTYEDSRKSGQVEHLTVSDAEALIAAGVGVIFSNPEPIDGQPESHPLVRFETLLIDISKHLQDLSKLSPPAVDGLLRGLQTWYPIESLPAVLQKLGEPWSALWNQPFVQEQLTLIAPSPTPETTNHTPVDEASQPPTPSSDTVVPTYRISTPISQEIDEYLNDFRTASPTKAYEKFLTGYSAGFYPTIPTLGKLINALGRSGDIEKVNFVYEVAQHALTVNKAHRREDPNEPWCQIEDHMIMALAHAGNVEAAHNHRLRILGCGGTPSADAYGALISCVKDTTDDSANAYSLYRESQIRGVIPNVYLYNTMISKLAKARKADLAMELFSKMKENGFWPSSVSYGAVIGACSRVGDVESAEALFKEMSSQPNFKPRVPPFNTMMQLYTYTKRNRDKVLHYYDAMVSAGVRPTAHTYKLLMDAYATIEPSNVTAMEQTFAALCADKSVQVLGTHWGSLINAYGCVQKDLERAIEVFEGIASHPSTRKGGPMPDAVAYEALINVFVTLRRTDLIPVYMDRFQSSGVHLTAYIANLLIKGYAVAGDLTKARGVFASLVDPPTGVAAPNNHAPHELDSTVPVHSGAPVYREPSTWEAMVRAELGNGNREEAVALLERMQARQFPAAVYSRISGIMLDGSVSPWPAPSLTPEQQ